MEMEARGADTTHGPAYVIPRGHFGFLGAHLAELYVGTLFLIYIALILLSRSVPSLTDYGDWTYEGVLFRNHVLGIPDPAHTLKHYPVPNSLNTLGIGLLALLLPWQLAAKVWLSLLLLASFGVCRYILKRRPQSSTIWLIAPAGLFLSVNLWYGFLNFQAGVTLTILIAALLFGDLRREIWIGFLLAVTFFAHMIPFLFSCLIVVLFALQSRRRRLLLQVLPGIVLTLWYATGRFFFAHNADGNAGMVGAVRNYSAAFWAYKINSYLKSLGFVNPGLPTGSTAVHIFGPAIFLLLFLLNGILCGIVAWSLFQTGRLALLSKSRERFLWIAGFLFMPLYLAAPATTLGISDPGSRLLQTALSLLVFLLAGTHASSAKLLRWAAGCSVALQVAALFLFAKVALSPEHGIATIPHVPMKVTVFAHVPNHGEDFYYGAIERGDMGLAIFPTAMFLNTPAARVPRGND